MHSIILRSALVTLACATAVIIASPSLSFAEMVTLKAALKGSNEVPPNDSQGTGAVTATYDTASKKLSWTGDYTGLTGTITAVHFHGSTPPSPPARNSAVVVPTLATSSPFEGSAILTDDQAADLLAGHWYFNIHTAAYPAGEIRGQMTK